jgi:hypothetical protein
MRRRTGFLRSTGDLIVMSRLLVLQSRRILLATTEKKLRAEDDPELRKRLGNHQAAAAGAHDAYRAAVLTWASPESTQFWMVAYATMIDGVEDLAGQLRARSYELPGRDRIAIQSDLAQLDRIIKRWRSTMLAPMGDVAAG